MPTNPDPRLTVAREYLGSEHRYAEMMLAAIDVRDSLRHPPGNEAVEAALDEWFNGNEWSAGRDANSIQRLQDDMRRGLTAALAVMAGTEVKHSPLPEAPPAEKPEWTAEQREAVLTAIKGLFVGVQNSMDVLTVRRMVFDTEQKFLAAFAKSELVWPPSGCRMPEGYKCHEICVRTDCPDAGERADG